MRARTLWTLAALLAIGCSTAPHCAERAPVVPGNVRGAFGEPVTMPGATRDFQVYKRGSGPPVVVFHELPGLSPATFRLAHRLSEANFTVYVPLLFGKPGDFRPKLNFLRVCVFGGDFDCRSLTTSGPIAEELQPLVAKIDRDHGSRGVSAIGMCLTGALPLELCAKGSPIHAAVVAQPALPFGSPATLPIPPGTLERMKAQGVAVLATRFTSDTRSPAARLQPIRAVFGDEAVKEIRSGKGTLLPEKAHAVLTTWYCDAPGDERRDVLEKAIAVFRSAAE